MKRQLKLGLLMATVPLTLFACGDDKDESSDLIETTPPAESSDTSPSGQSSEDALAMVEDYNPDAPDGGNEAVLELKLLAEDGMLSKGEILNALESSYSEDILNYALDATSIDWDAQALKTAQMYQSEMMASEDMIREMMVDPDMGGYSEEETNQAIAQLDPNAYMDAPVDDGE